MAKILKFNENVPYSELDTIFHCLKRYGLEHDIKFLESLKLTTDQYIRLARLIECYGDVCEMPY